MSGSVSCAIMGSVPVSTYCEIGFYFVAQCFAAESDCVAASTRTYTAAQSSRRWRHIIRHGQSNTVELQPFLLSMNGSLTAVE